VAARGSEAPSPSFAADASGVGLVGVGVGVSPLNSDASLPVEKSSSSSCALVVPSGAGGDPAFPRDPADVARNPFAENAPVSIDVASESAGLGTTPAASNHAESKRDREYSLVQSLSLDMYACALPDPPSTSSSSLSVAPLPIEPSVVKGASETPATKRTAEHTETERTTTGGEWCLSLGGHVVRDMGRPFCLEIFAGSAGLTAALRSAGFDAWGVDYGKSRLLSLTPALLNLDLCTEAGGRHLETLLGHPQLAFAHFAPPCGAASRAREIP